jgi:hypothetical protein
MDSERRQTANLPESSRAQTDGRTPSVAPGKVSRIQRRYQPASSGVGRKDDAGVRSIAAAGVTGAGAELPHLDTIQRSFGRHDVGDVTAHVGGPAASAAVQLEAIAYATGTHVAFAEQPSVELAAHEAAHVVQQRGGVQFRGAKGETGDRYERHADEVASLVVQGKSAEALLDSVAGGGQASYAQAKSNASLVQAKHNGQKRNHKDENTKVNWHVMYHDIAKRIAYAGKIDKKKYPRIADLWHARPVKGRDGFMAVVLTPRRDGLPTIVAFTGTDDPLDLFADLHPSGVGYQQFKRNTPWIERAIKGAKQPLVLTGHSLGGGLAQMAAATFGAKYSIAEVVTFQSSGIPAHLKRKFEAIGKGKKPETTHWVAENDAVNVAGQTKLAGDTYTVRNQKKTAAGDPVGLHRGDLLTLKGGKVAATGPVRKSGKDPYARDRKTGERARTRLLDLARYLQRTLELGRIPATFDLLMAQVLKKVDSTWFQVKYAWNSEKILNGFSDRLMRVIREITQLEDERLRGTLQRFVLKSLRDLTDLLKRKRDED